MILTRDYIGTLKHTCILMVLHLYVLGCLQIISTMLNVNIVLLFPKDDNVLKVRGFGVHDELFTTGKQKTILLQREGSDIVLVHNGQLDRMSHFTATGRCV